MRHGQAPQRQRKQEGGRGLDGLHLRRADDVQRPFDDADRQNRRDDATAVKPPAEQDRGSEDDIGIAAANPAEQTRIAGQAKRGHRGEDDQAAGSHPGKDLPYLRRGQSVSLTSDERRDDGREPSSHR